MNQDEINQQEWQKPQNWSLLCYHSERDTRKLVPKRFGIGWTYNFGTKKRARWVWVLVAFAGAGLIMALILRVEFRRP
jgi:uncharacterized membrane protein